MKWRGCQSAIVSDNNLIRRHPPHRVSLKVRINSVTEVIMYKGRVSTIFKALPALTAIAMFGVCESASAQSGILTSIFSFLNGFAGAASTLQMVGVAGVNGSVLALTTGSAGHQTGCVWYKTPQNIQAFTTDFTFQIPPTSSMPAMQGIAFAVQNSNSTTNPGQGGPNSCGDANLLGYGAYVGYGQHSVANSIGVKFDLNSYSNFDYPAGATPSSTGLYVNGGPSDIMIPANDLNPYAINLYSGHVMAAHIVYDGTLLTLVLKDTTTNAQARYSWPINIPAITGSNTAYVGFTGGQVVNNAIQNVLTWSYSTGYAPRLATPSFSVTPGAYAATQNVALSGPPGATIYYTINGLQPTSSSTQYTGPIPVSSNEIIQAVAIEAGFSDSLTAVGNYQISPSSAPLINFANGFSGASKLVIPVGYAKFNGSSLLLTDNVNPSEVAAAWYAVPVNVSAFSTKFTFQITNAQANGFTFAVQNQPPASSTTATGITPSWVSGGPTAIAGSWTGLGYSQAAGTTGKTSGLLSSIAVSFDNTNNTGLYVNGALPSGSGTSIAGINVDSGHPITVAFAYAGTTLSMTMTDTVTQAIFSHSWTVNIPATVGASTAYVGFTASTEDGQGENLALTAWTYSATPVSSPPTPVVAVPAAPSNLHVQ